MKHINLSSWKGIITDWTKLNYVKGGLADEYADIANVKGNYVKKSENLCLTNSYDGIMNNTIARSIDLGNLPNGTYTISFNVLANAGNRAFIIFYVNNGVVDSEHNINTSLSGTGQKSYTFTLDNSIPYDDIIIAINSSSLNYSIELENLMLNKGSTALPYQPGSNTGLYIEDNVNDELIPINDPPLLLMRNIDSIIPDDLVIEDELNK